MKTGRPVLGLLMALVLMAGLATYFSGCSSESPFEPISSVRGDVHSPIPAAAKANKYPQTGSVTLTCHTYDGWRVTRDGLVVPFVMHYYEGGEIKLEQGSYLQIEAGSLMPPDELLGENVTIEMFADHRTEINQLYFEFGPSGCHFDTPVEIWLKWSDLGSDNVILFYIDENGNYIQQNPAQIDYQGKRLKIHVDHFSRYAVAFTN